MALYRNSQGRNGRSQSAGIARISSTTPPGERFRARVALGTSGDMLTLAGRGDAGPLIRKPVDRAGSRSERASKIRAGCRLARSKWETGKEMTTPSPAIRFSTRGLLPDLPIPGPRSVHEAARWQQSVAPPGKSPETSMRRAGAHTDVLGGTSLDRAFGMDKGTRATASPSSTR